MSGSIRPISAPTPRTRSVTNASGCTGSSASTCAGARSFTSASYSSESARSRASRLVPTAVTGDLDAGEVVTRAGVDLHLVAGVDEQRDLHHQTGLEGGG